MTSVTLPANTASVTAYYGDTKAGTPTITAAASGLTSATQQETITAGAGTQLAITSSAFSGRRATSATNAFTVTLEDTYGNATTSGQRHHGEPDLESAGHPRVRRHLGRDDRDQRQPAGQHRLGDRLLRRHQGRDPDHHRGGERV